MYRHLLLIFAFISNLMLATTFIPVSFEEQLREADGIIFGIPKSSASRKTPDGLIVTDYKVSVKSYVGLRNSGPIDQQMVTLSIPGGKWNGVVTKIWGTPSIEEGKKFAAVVRKKHATYELLNLGLSFFVKKNKRSDLWQSEYFSGLEGVGRIYEEDMISKAEKVFGSKQLTIVSDKQVYKRTRVNRKPASFSNEELIDKQKTESKGVLTVWVFLAMALLVILSQYLIRRD